MNEINVDEILRKCRIKIEYQVKENPDVIPYIAMEDEKYLSHKNCYWWTNGFFSGILWLMYNEYQVNEFLMCTEKIENEFDKLFLEYTDKLHHDVGFMYMPTAVINYKVNLEKRSYLRGLLAANMLAGRFNPCGEYIVAWNEEPEYLIADTLMNLPLLFWASNETDDPRFENIAKNHLNTVIKYLIREDGSCSHIIKMNPKTGKFIESIAGQGYSDDSAWARGQSWIIYGMIIAYKYTNEELYLHKGMKVLDYYIDYLLKTDYNFALDLNTNEQDNLLDTSAAAVVASALIDYAEIVDTELSNYYLKIAKNILYQLDYEFCNYSLNLGGILEKSSEAYHKSDTHHCSIIYGDYFYIEAICKLKSNNYISIW